MSLDYTIHPVQAGFDYFAGTQGNFSGNNYCSWPRVHAERTGPGENDIFSEEILWDVYLTHQTISDSIDHIKQMREPWFSQVAFNASHAPLHVPPSDPYDCTPANSGNNPSTLQILSAPKH